MDKKYLQGYADLTDPNDIELPEEIDLRLEDFMSKRECDSFIDGLIEFLADDWGFNIKACNISINVSNINWDKEE